MIGTGRRPATEARLRACARLLCRPDLLATMEAEREEWESYGGESDVDLLVRLVRRWPKEDRQRLAALIREDLRADEWDEGEGRAEDGS